MVWLGGQIPENRLQAPKVLLSNPEFNEKGILTIWTKDQASKDELIQSSIPLLKNELINDFINEKKGEIKESYKEKKKKY